MARIRNPLTPDLPLHQLRVPGVPAVHYIAGRDVDSGQSCDLVSDCGGSQAPRIEKVSVAQALQAHRAQGSLFSMEAKQLGHVFRTDRRWVAQPCADGVVRPGGL